jgi:hypothetical protein
MQLPAAQTSLEPHPQRRVKLPPQLRDQRRQRADLRRLLTVQRITRILRWQRLGHSTRSSPKPAPSAARRPVRSATVTREPVTHFHAKTAINRGRDAYGTCSARIS